MYFKHCWLGVWLLFFYASTLFATLPRLDSITKLPIHVENRVLTVELKLTTPVNETPRPTIRVREGERLHFIVKNTSDNDLQITPPFSQSEELIPLIPQQTLEFRFVADYPGIYLYRLSPETYGALIVEPKEGYPTQVDREYVLIQSECKKTGLISFNGTPFKYIGEPLVAEPGERLRLFVINAGPTGTSNFHVVGAPFNKVLLNGSLKKAQTDTDNVRLEPRGSAIIELEIPEAGKYVMMDHDFGDANLGAMGLIDATGLSPHQPLASNR